MSYHKTLYFSDWAIITKLSIVCTLIYLCLANSLFGEEILRLHINGEANGVVDIRLNELKAPLHTERIRLLTKEGKYDGVTFHRVIEGFMAQTGDVKYGNVENFQPTLAGMGGSEYPMLISEFSDQPFLAGSIGMARSSDPNSANSQFFIMFDSAPHLNGKYTIVGEVVSGLETVKNIKKGNSAANGSVNNPDYILKAELITTN